MEKLLFTSESVTEGHPDKMCDAISDAILDALMEKDPMSRVACETCCTTGLVMVMGEVTTNAYVDIQKIVRDTGRKNIICMLMKEMSKSEYKNGNNEVSVDTQICQKLNPLRNSDKSKMWNEAYTNSFRLVEIAGWSKDLWFVDSLTRESLIITSLKDGIITIDCMAGDTILDFVKILKSVFVPYSNLYGIKAIEVAFNEFSIKVDDHNVDSILYLYKRSCDLSQGLYEKELQEYYNEQADQYEKQLIDNKQKVQATIQVAINNYEKEQKINFYKLQIPQKDLEDIKLIRSIENKINHKEALGKIIYKVYLEKPTNDLINRIIGKTDICGIYKITNLNNQMCYVGQSVNIKKRWVQHIKRAVNAETRTKNKLYPAMDEFGIENFSFELIDQCDKDKLNSREQYWQDYYSAKTFGYSIK